MDEDYNNRMMSEERMRMEREAKAIRGCGLLSLIVAVVVAAILIIIKWVSV